MSGMGQRIKPLARYCELTVEAGIITCVAAHQAELGWYLVSEAEGLGFKRVGT